LPASSSIAPYAQIINAQIINARLGINARYHWPEGPVAGNAADNRQTLKDIT
jgi:hypothetical protein